jgi:hypothetical protein
MALCGLEGIMTMYPRPFCLQTVVFGSYVRCMMHDPPFAVTVTQYLVPAAPYPLCAPFINYNRLVGFISRHKHR